MARRYRVTWLFASGGLWCHSAALGQPGEFLLITKSFDVTPIRVLAINDQAIEHFEEASAFVRVPLDDAIALLNPHASIGKRTTGLLMLADGQRLPGEPIVSARPGVNMLAWNHPWLGRLDVPFTLIESVLLTADAVPPEPGDADVVLLSNGDRQEGFIISVGDPITLEAEWGDDRQDIEIPLRLVTALTMVAPRQKPTGRRIWFAEGTVLDVQSLVVADEGLVRLAGSSLASGTQPTQVKLSEIVAVLFDHDAMIPLAAIRPARIEGPPTRYMLPRPRLTEPDAPLGISTIEFTGPIVVRYSLPPGCRRFHAEAELPRASRAWGDFELIIRTEDDEVFRTRLDSEHPAATIDVPITGRELTIEISEGAHGPIQDDLLLIRAMLLTTR